MFKVNNLNFVSSKNPFSAEFERINVIMGANGSGKTSLLRSIASDAVTRRWKPVFIEGGRRADIDVNVGIDGNTLDIYSNPVGHEQNYIANRSSDIAIRMKTALRLLKALEQARKASHSDEVEAWRGSGQEGDMPPRPRMPFDRFTAFFETMFPDLKSM